MSNNLPKSYVEDKKEAAIRRNIVFLKENGVQVNSAQEKRMLRGESIIESGIDIQDDRYPR